MYHIDLWKISGHYKNYKENLFMVKTNEHKHVHHHDEHIHHH